MSKTPFVLDKNFTFGTEDSPNFSKKNTLDDISSSDPFDVDIEFSDRKGILTHREPSFQLEKHTLSERNTDIEHSQFMHTEFGIKESRFDTNTGKNSLVKGEHDKSTEMEIEPQDNF